MLWRLFMSLWLHGGNTIEWVLLHISFRLCIWRRHGGSLSNYIMETDKWGRWGSDSLFGWLSSLRKVMEKMLIIHIKSILNKFILKSTQYLNCSSIIAQKIDAIIPRLENCNLGQQSSHSSNWQMSNVRICLSLSFYSLTC